MTGAWRAGLLGGALASLMLALILARAGSLRWPEASPYAGDFIHEYSTSWVVRSGDPARLYDATYLSGVQHDSALLGFEWNPDAFNVPYYPPWYYLLISPLSRLDYRSAAHLWIAFLVLCFAAAAALLAWHHAELRPHLIWMLPGAFLFQPLTESVVSSQKGTLWLLVLVATYVLFQRGWVAWAGAVYGLLALKPPLGLAIGAWMLWKRQWRFLAAAAATASLLVMASWIWIPEAVPGWIRAVLHPIPQDQPALLRKSHCWLGFVRLLVRRYAGAAVATLTLALVAATVAALVALLRGPLRPGSRRFALQYCGALLATILISPHLYTYDLTLLLGAFGILAAEPVPAAPEAPGAARRRAWLLVLWAVVVTVSAPVAGLTSLQLSVPANFVALWALSRAAGTTPTGTAPATRSL